MKTFLVGLLFGFYGLIGTIALVWWGSDSSIDDVMAAPAGGVVGFIAGVAWAVSRPKNDPPPPPVPAPQLPQARVVDESGRGDLATR